MRLSCVFDDNQIVRSRDLQNWIHIGDLAVEMHWDDRLGAFGDRALNPGDVYGVGFGVNVDEDGLGPRIVDGRCGGYKSKGDRDHLITRSDAGRQQSQV